MALSEQLLAISSGQSNNGAKSLIFSGGADVEGGGRNPPSNALK